jgi:hypothetical protein
MAPKKVVSRVKLLVLGGTSFFVCLWMFLIQSNMTFVLQRVSLVRRAAGLASMKGNWPDEGESKRYMAWQMKKS